MNYVYITLQDLNDKILTFMSNKNSSDYKFLSTSQQIEDSKQQFIKNNKSTIIAKIDLDAMKLLPIDQVLVEQPPVVLTHYVPVGAPIESNTIESDTIDKPPVELTYSLIMENINKHLPVDVPIESKTIESETIESETIDKPPVELTYSLIMENINKHLPVDVPIESETIESETIESETIESETIESDGIFHKMKIIQYGKGVALIPSYNHKDFCKKYNHDGCGNTGWWNKNCDGWFFKKQFLKNLIINGAELDESITAFQLSAIFKEDESSVETVD